MKLNELLRTIKRENIQKIIVTGPHRSGTAIGAYILAKELSLPLYTDKFFDGDFKKFVQKVEKLKSFVVQCPSLLFEAKNTRPEVLLVCMNRELTDILMSQRRIGWEPDGKDEYKFMQTKCLDINKPLAYKKYQYLSLLVSPTRRVEYLDFESLEQHKMYIDRMSRRRFKEFQISEKIKSVSKFIDFSTEQQ